MAETDKYQERHIVRIKDYQFQDGEGIRDKYVIILNRDENHTYVIHTLTTKQAKGFNPPKKGCNKSGKISYFFIAKDDIIGENGFMFELDTFIFFGNNIKKELLANLKKYPDSYVEVKDIMDKSIFKTIIDCMLSSEFINYEQADCLRKSRQRL